jgi:hypothetical protein
MGLSAPISASSSGDNTVVAGVTGKSIAVESYEISASAAVNAKWKDGSTDKTGLLYMAAAGSQVDASAADLEAGEDELWVGTAGQALVLNLSGAVAVGGLVTYRLD